MGLGMVSCVESEESPSVEAIRNAKAEQLKALAELSKAQAEAAKITANAEAALKNAEAEYTKEMTKEAAEKFAVEIEQIKAEAEAAIAKALKQAELHKQQMQANANQHIQDLYDAYTTVMGTLATEKGNLVTAKSDLLALELGVINTEDGSASTLRYYETQLAQKEAELEVLQDPKYTSINIDSIRVLWSAASKKATLDRSYYNNSEVVKAMNVALDTAEAVEGRFFTSINDINTFLKNMTDGTNNQVYDNIVQDI